MNKLHHSYHAVRRNVRAVKHVPRRHLAVEGVMLSLLGVSLVFLGIELLGRPTAQQLELMHRIDISIGLIFLAEFIVRFALASDRPGYVRRYWWVLLGTIPISFPAFQALRFVRVGALLQLAQSYAHLEYEIRQK